VPIFQNCLDLDHEIPNEHESECSLDRQGDSAAARRRLEWSPVSSEARPDVTIIIPVFNQAEELRRCLHALETQTYPCSRFEVVVVDNGSAAPVSEMTESFPFARCIREEKPGSYTGRNRGIVASRAELLCFTDADCVPTATWLERGIRAIQRLPGPGGVGGQVKLAYHDATKRTAAELFESVFAFRQKKYFEWGFAATANLFTTRATFDRVGLFDERLMSGGDLEWGHRLRARGLAQDYADDVCVVHDARQTLGQLLRKTVRVAGGLQQIAEQQGRGTTGLLRHAVRELIQLRTIRAHMSDERLGTIDQKLRFAGVAWVVEIVRTLERYRVHYGGAPRRT
jgi:GT2 family glycosyltransferase